MRISIRSALGAIAVVCALAAPGYAASINAAALKGWEIKKVYGGYDATCPESRCGSEILSSYNDAPITRLEAKLFSDPNSLYSKNAERMLIASFRGASFFSPLKMKIVGKPKRIKVKGMPALQANMEATMRILGESIKVHGEMVMATDGKRAYTFVGAGDNRQHAIRGRKKILSAWRP